MEKAKKTAEDVQQKQKEEGERKREVGRFGEELKGMERDFKEIEKKRDKVGPGEGCEMRGISKYDIYVSAIGTRQGWKSPGFVGQGQRAG